MRAELTTRVKLSGRITAGQTVDLIRIQVGQNPPTFEVQVSSVKVRQSSDLTQAMRYFAATR